MSISLEDIEKDDDEVFYDEENINNYFIDDVIEDENGNVHELDFN